MARKVDPGAIALAVKIREAADLELSNNDVVNRLRDALNDEHRGTGSYAYYIDHFGDGTDGDVIYMCDGDTMRAPYEMSEGGADGSAAQRCEIDFDNAEDVVPRTIYEPEEEEEEHYAAMEEAYRRDELYSALPLYERFISKSERDNADAEDFAGKGKSFPILKPGDIMAAVRSMGRAGSKNLSPSGLKSKIIAIAKRKGWTKYLPKAWRGDAGETEDKGKGKEKAEESRRRSAAAGQLRIVESAATLERIVLREARADYPIKLIAPGKGSSAFYPAEVLKRDGPKVFKAGTHVYLNHPTAAEESARPEGDVANLAGVLTRDAVYHESHKNGPGLYGDMKVFADHAQLVEEKAPHVGMSIRAQGIAEANQRREGVPVLKELVAADSVDVVTRAGAGGMILTESAGGQTQETGDDMERNQITRLLERALREDAQTVAARRLDGLALHEAAKAMVVENVMRLELPRTAAGELDVTRFNESVDAEAKRVGALLATTGAGGRVLGMGASTVQVSVEEAARQKQQAADELAAAEDTFKRIGLSERAAKAAARGQQQLVA